MTDDDARTEARVLRILKDLADTQDETTSGATEPEADTVAHTLAALLAPLPSATPAALAVDELMSRSVTDESGDEHSAARRQRLAARLDIALAERRRDHGLILATLRERRRSDGLAIAAVAASVRSSHNPDRDAGWEPPTDDQLDEIESGRRDFRTVDTGLLARMATVYGLPADKARLAYVRSLLASDESQHAAAAGTADSDRLHEADRKLADAFGRALESDSHD